MVIVALLTWTDIEIKKIQPYIDLIHGDSPPQRSLLLDYTRTKYALHLHCSLDSLLNHTLVTLLFGYQPSGISTSWLLLLH